MDPFTAIGGVASGVLGMLGAKDANEAAAEEARKNRAFQREMSNTAYQRGMKDMRRAGLNPMLAAKVGGASSPAGNVANVTNELAPLANAAGDLAGKVNATALNKAQLANMGLQNDVLAEQVRQLQIANAKAGATQPIYEKIGALVKVGTEKASELTGDLIGDVLNAGERADGSDQPNSALDLSRFIGSEDSQARAWARGEKPFLQSLRDASKAADEHSNPRLTPEALKKWGLKNYTGR